ncbi:Macrolide export ATP-binding/permease protein MacB [Fusobacterium necrogenes]|uniref:Macrolide export ATP-binding/permease protein MacB n=2 Tax=Fusobacterium necrogenes TaxID=858 RepID=A0A377GZE0_9FUSO|nr:Macrolide export ATP-binding/permease protein MacB [Fusobacterium necrogenes]
MIFWFAYKMLLGNSKRAIFPLLGVIGGITALIMSFSLGAGGEKIISTNLSAIGSNRIMIGGQEMSARDMQIIENYPFVEYTLFPGARENSGNNIFIGYSQKALMALGLRNLGDREVILDKNQFPDKQPGDRVDLVTEMGTRSFIVAGIYEEQNPFELMKQGNRIIVSQGYFERLFGRYRYNELIVSFDKGEDAEDLIPLLLRKFNEDRRSYGQVRLLETPEVYKRIVKIQKIVRNTLGILSFISLCIGGFGIMNLIAGGVRARTGHIGILRAMGMSKKDIIKIFLAEGIIISIIGSFLGVIIGIIGAVMSGKLIMIPPEFNILQILLALIVSLVFGIVMGVYPAKKAGDISITDALRDI